MTMAGIALLRPMKIRSACSLIGNRLFSRTPRSLCELPELKGSSRTSDSKISAAAAAAADLSSIPFLDVTVI